MATTLLVGISRQTPVEKYLDNADDKRLLNLICKLEGWHGAERKEGLCNPPSRAVGKMKRGAFKFTACSRYLMMGERGEGRGGGLETSTCLLPVRSWRASCKMFSDFCRVVFIPSKFELSPMQRASLFHSHC